MGKPEFSSFEQFVPPKSLAERLKAQANGQAEVEAASFMAERFAPDPQTPAANRAGAERAASRTVAEAAVRTREPALAERSARSSGLMLGRFRPRCARAGHCVSRRCIRVARSASPVCRCWIGDRDKQAPAGGARRNRRSPRFSRLPPQVRLNQRPYFPSGTSSFRRSLLRCPAPSRPRRARSLPSSSPWTAARRCPGAASSPFAGYPRARASPPGVPSARRNGA